MKVINLNDDNFDQQTSSGVTLVDFYADWCGPCKRMAPTLDSLASRLAGQASIAKVNVDHSPNLSNRFGVRGIPMFVVMKDGQVINKSTGSKSEQQLLDLLGLGGNQ
tara:strand:- start:103 stop:423 length:321 start_codon:yes stop_codon:yes gene_type:complete